MSENQTALSNAGWTIMSMFALAVVTNTALVVLMSLGLPVPTIAATVLIVFINVMAIIGMNSSIDDMSAALKDLSEDELKLNRYKTWINAPFIMYRGLIIIGFGGTGAGLLLALFTG